MKHLTELTQLPYRNAPGYEAFSRPFPSSGPVDVDLGLYGGFASDRDRQRLNNYRIPDSPDFLRLPEGFDDARYRELCWRFKARNFPERLDAEEAREWLSFCKSRWFEKTAGAAMIVDEFMHKVHTIRSLNRLDETESAILDATERYVRELTGVSGLA